MQFTAPILLIRLSNHLLRKGDLFFRKRGERRKKETPLILYTKFRDMEQKSLYQNSARTGNHYIRSAYTVIGSFFLISSQEQPTHLSTWMANKDRNSIPLKYNKQKKTISKNLKGITFFQIFQNGLVTLFVTSYY